MKRALWHLALLAICVLAFAARCWDLRSTFIDGRIYFVDGDCYSRMTRAAMVADGRALIISRHDFENWPAGTVPHTTAPMDWLIAVSGKVLDLGFSIFDSDKTSVLRGQTLDLAGALISPLLGMLACFFVGFVCRRIAPPGASLLAAFFFAVSPILVHGTLLGRPDHQSLLLLLLAVALGAELALGKGLARFWGTVAGVAWALAMWVSLYEPLILLALVLAIWAVADRRRFSAREMRAGWIAFAAIFCGTLLLEGWRLAWPDATLRTYFENWKTNIGELAHLDPRTSLLYRWATWAIVPAPVLLYLAGRKDRRAWALAIALVAVFALTVWQLRWGYFLALLFALALPWMVAAFSRRWIAYLLLGISFWPLAGDWDERLFVSAEREKQTAIKRRELVVLRLHAEAMRSRERAPFLAPWWLSPPLAYWSGQPGVAGSSHESLGGIVDSARFFLTENPAEAAAILKARGVAWVLVEETSRVVGTSSALLAVEPPAMPLVETLFEHPSNAPSFLMLEKLQGPPVAGPQPLYLPTFYQLYRVENTGLLP